MEDALENLLSYVLEKQPCEPVPFEPSQIYKALENHDLQLVRCIIVHILNRFKKVFVNKFCQEKKEFVQLFDLQFIRKGAWGSVFTFAEKSQSPFAIGKYTTLEEDDEKSSIQKEIVIGLLLNTIHEEAPNFMYTYAGFLCGFQNREKLQTLCGEDGPLVSIGMFENIQGRLLMEMDLSTQQLICILLQIIYSLQIAYVRFGFLHNDLHDENIIVKVLPENQIVHLNSFSFQTNLIPIIVDYGAATVFFKDESNVNHFLNTKKLKNQMKDIKFLISNLHTSETFKNYMLRLCSQNNNLSMLLEELKRLYKNPKPLDSFDRKNKREEEEEEEITKLRKLVEEENIDDMLREKFIQFFMNRNAVDLFVEFLQESQIIPKDIFLFILKNLFGLNNPDTNCKFRINIDYYKFFFKFLEINSDIRQEYISTYNIRMSISREDQIKTIFLKLLQKECSFATKKEIQDFFAFKRIIDFNSILENYNF